MVRRRQVGDPWYTALYLEPHTLWWASAVIVFVVVFSLNRFGSNESAATALGYAAAFAAAYAAIGYVRWRRDKE